VFLFEALTPLFLENDHFVPFQVLYHLGLHGRTFYDRGANGDVTSVFQKKDLVKGDLFAFFLLQTVNVHFLVFCNFELLPCHLYNCVHNALIRLKLLRFIQLSGCKYTAKYLIYKHRSPNSHYFLGSLTDLYNCMMARVRTTVVAKPMMATVKKTMLSKFSKSLDQARERCSRKAVSISVA